MAMNKVTVVMAEYNTDERYLRQAIQSVLDQTYYNFEFIIVDDGGVNDLVSIVRGFNDERLKIISNGGNKGFVYSLNNGISHAVGEYIVRMDTDDIIEKDRIAILYDFINKHPQYEVVSSRAMEFSGNIKYGIIGTTGEKKRKDVMRGDTPVHAAAIVKKSAFEDIGGYKENYTRAEDLVLWCDMLLAGKRLYVLNDVLYFYRVNKADYSKRTLRHRKGEITARLHYYPKLKAGPIEYMRIVKSIVAGILPTNMIQAYRNKFVVNKEDL